MQVDFTEGRLAIKIDPSGELLHRFIDLNNLALSRFSAEERTRIGVHTCPGGDRDSTHSADVDYAALLPSLFELMAGCFYVALAGETDRVRVLKIIRDHLKPDQMVFVGVINPDRSTDRDPAGGVRPCARGRGVHSGRATRHVRRLRLLAILRRHHDDPRDGVRENPRAGDRDRAGQRTAAGT